MVPARGPHGARTGPRARPRIALARGAMEGLVTMAQDVSENTNCCPSRVLAVLHVGAAGTTVCAA
jgi:hypothetical protein